MSFRSPAPGSNPWYCVHDSASTGQVLAALRADGLLVRHLRGRRMRTLGQVFGEFAAAFQFPPYFGDNWHAFDECLGDLDWLNVDQGVAVVIDDSVKLLEEDPDELGRLVRGIGYAAAEWASTTELGPGVGRPAMPFVVVVHMSNAGLPEGRAVWEAVGVEFGDFVAD